MAVTAATADLRARDLSRSAFASFRGNVLGARSALSSLRREALGALAALGAGAAAKQLLDSADRIQKLSQRLGISTTALSELGYAAGQSGIPVETFAVALQRMTRRVAEAAAGTGQARGSLLELGLSAAKLNSLPLDTQFEAVGQALSEVPNDADRVRLAFQLFDSEGVAVLQTMQDGARGIEDYRAQARALGLSLGTEQVNAAAAAKNAMNDLSKSVVGLANAGLVTFGDTIVQVSGVLQNVLRPAFDTVRAGFATLGNLIGGVASAVANFGRGLFAIFQSIGRGIGGLVASFGALISGNLSEAKSIFSSTVDDFKAGMGDAFDSLREGGTALGMTLKDAVGGIGDTAAAAVSGWDRFKESLKQGAETAKSTSAALRETDAAINKVRQPKLSAAEALKAIGSGAKKATSFEVADLSRLAIHGIQGTGDRAQEVKSPQLATLIDLQRQMLAKLGAPPAVGYGA